MPLARIDRAVVVRDLPGRVEVEVRIPDPLPVGLLIALVSAGMLICRNWSSASLGTNQRPRDPDRDHPVGVWIAGLAKLTGSEP